ncbi:MAG TPA: metallophosphoesterase [Rhabdochlamydiaceae bacterium]
MKIVCVSDPHCQLNKIAIPDGDVLVCTGDLTYQGTVQETSKELFELSKHRARFKEIIFVEGNHDWLGQRNPSLMDQMCKDNGIILLRDSGTTIEGIRFYGSPWQPEFGQWAFNLPRGRALREKWALIPDDTQVLLTHSPPMGILDIVERFNHQTCNYDLEHVGCADLNSRIQDLKELQLHVFGHLHLGAGNKKIGNTMFVNASVCTEQYKPTNPIFVYDL